LAELQDIRQLLVFNKFEKVKRACYFNAAYGPIPEDMHDENVLACDNMLFFIDNIFYTGLRKI
jgi:hypothetical protein